MQQFGTVVKNLPADAEDAVSTPGSGRSPGGGNGNPLQYFCLENPMDQRSLEGYSPWGLRESDTTEPLSVHTHISFEAAILVQEFNMYFYMCEIQDYSLCGL